MNIAPAAARPLHLVAYAMNGHRFALETLLAAGVPDDAIEHAHFVANVMGVLYAAFSEAGLECTLVGGSAIEVHAPGIYKSADIDLVVDTLQRANLLDRITAVFEQLGFTKANRHWVLDNLFVEVPSFELDGPRELVAADDASFFVVKKEALVLSRTIGFMHWQWTGYGQQVVDMLAAFGDSLDMSWLRPALERERSWVAFEHLQTLARTDAPVTETVLRDLLDNLHGRPRTPSVEIDDPAPDVEPADEPPR